MTISLGQTSLKYIKLENHIKPAEETKPKAQISSITKIIPNQNYPYKLNYKTEKRNRHTSGQKQLDFMANIIKKVIHFN